MQRALATVVREDASELIALEEQRLDDLTRTLQRVMTTRHYLATASGKLATNPATGELVADDGPVIAPARELRMVSESHRRLLGLDAPAKHRVDVIDEAAIDAELLRLADELNLGGDHARAHEGRRAVKGGASALAPETCAPCNWRQPADPMQGRHGASTRRSPMRRSPAAGPCSARRWHVAR